MKTLVFAVISISLLISRTTFAQESAGGGLEETDTGYLASGDVDTTARSTDKQPPGRFYFRDEIDIPVFDQFKLPACVGYAIASSVGIRLNTYCRNDCNCRQNLSPFSASYIFNQIYREGAKGISLATGLDTLWAQGICPENDFKNNGRLATKKPDKAARLAASRFRFWQKRERIFFLPDEIPDPEKRYALMLELVRRHVSARLPVIVGLRCPPDFFTFRGGEYRPGEIPEKANHAVVVTGYDDKKRVIEILNSQGTDWGDKGFVRIGYDDFCKMARYGYITRLDGGAGATCNKR